MERRKCGAFLMGRRKVNLILPDEGPGGVWREKRRHDFTRRGVWRGTDGKKEAMILPSEGSEVGSSVKNKP